LQKYIKPKQREVTRILLYAAQACHDLVPSDIVQNLARCIAQNFITDGNSPEAICVGINAIRELFVNCSEFATEELIQDLAEVSYFKWHLINLTHFSTNLTRIRMCQWLLEA
jgi:protein SDA1